MIGTLSVLAMMGLAKSGMAEAQKAGTFEVAGSTEVSAMMMFVGNEEKVYILDKAEGNAAQINGHPAWGAVWDVNTRETSLMDVRTNVFCASGMHLPNGSFATFGGNGAVGVGGGVGSQMDPAGGAAYFDDTYQNYDGRKAIRVINPCKSSDNFDDVSCQWFDNPEVLSMQKNRWYSAAEPLGDGTVVLIGGFVNGGYVNRNWPNVDPEFEGGAADCTYEYYPANGREAKTMQFMIKTSGLNSYAHTYLMKSGKMLIQANYSTILWDHENNVEEELPDIPGNVIRVYPASGAVAMLPLTPENNYNPTVLFCGGTDMADEMWGNYSWPFINTWEYPASRDCQRLTGEPEDGSVPAYEQDDDMPEGRTMGQFVILPDGKLLIVNGGENGTAGYSEKTLLTTSYSDMPYGMSLASAPALTPAIYDPRAEKGKRWSNAGFEASQIPRLYHSSAVLLPDASVLIAGSNPNVDVNLTTLYPTEYRAEVFYPAYFSAATRPKPSGIPSTLSYGGDAFDVNIPADSYEGPANDAADSVVVGVVRTGWTTHALNMGQRFLQLNNTYTVKDDGSIVLHVAQMPPNSNIFQPGPAFVHVTINGIPSNGTYVIVGNGQIGEQPLGEATVLPASVRKDGVTGGGSVFTTDKNSTGSKDNAAASFAGVSAFAGLFAGLTALYGF